jgi:hypothetical protein
MTSGPCWFSSRHAIFIQVQAPNDDLVKTLCPVCRLYYVDHVRCLEITKGCPAKMLAVAYGGRRPGSLIGVY